MKKIIVILIAMLATTGLVAQNDHIARYLKIDKGNDNYEILNLDGGVSYSIKTEYNIVNKLVANIYDEDNNLLATYPASVKVYPMYDAVSFTMSDAENITLTEATFNASVTSILSVNDKGICYSSTNDTPTTDDSKVSKGSGVGAYTVTLTGLTENTLYYARPYAIVNGDATFYGEVKTFTTLPEEYVLINGIKWAKCNVDMPGTFAEKPEDAGMFYQWNRKTAWSATDPGPGVPMPGWDNTPPSGTTWEPDNDPSPAGYRVPTKEEIKSLLDETYVTNEWTTENGVTGYRCTDKNNGNSIFLPAAGYRYGSGGTLDYVGTDGGYWSSTQYNTYLAWGLDFYDTNVNVYNDSKTNGYSVRPVAE